MAMVLALIQGKGGEISKPFRYLMKSYLAAERSHPGSWGQKKGLCEHCH